MALEDKSKELYNEKGHVDNPEIARVMAEAEDSYHRPGISRALKEHGDASAEAAGQEALLKGIPIERDKVPTDVENALGAAISKLASGLSNAQPDHTIDKLSLFGRGIFEKIDDSIGSATYRLEGLMSYATAEGPASIWCSFSVEVRNSVVGPVATESRKLKSLSH